jgi:transcriptional regulator with XRE-family HTH domain
MPGRFGEKLRYLRLQRLLSQAELSRQLQQITQSYLSYLEAGRKSPSLESVLVIADFFGVTTDYLLHDTITPENPQRTVFSPHGSDTPTTLGERLRLLRQQQQWTQADLAARLPAATQAYISILEADRKIPAPEFIVLLADLFGVSTDYLLRG